MTINTFLSSDYIDNNSQAAAMLESHLQSELMPYLEDSVMKINIHFIDEHWLADVKIDSPRGLKAARKKDSNFESLVQNITENLRRQYELEQSSNKSEIFLFDQQQEYDHYTETVTSATNQADLKLRILLIEDDPTASLILEKSMQSKGCNVEIINNPRLAIDKIIHNDYDLIVLDWCLPYMSGHDFLKKADAKLSLKNLGNLSPKSIPLVVCSMKNSDEIHLPLVSNFLFCQYWNKQLPFSTVVSSIETALNSARKHKTKAA